MDWTTERDDETKMTYLIPLHENMTWDRLIVVV